LKTTNARIVELRRRLEPQEAHDREQLRLALEQQVEEGREILRSNPAQGRQVLAHVLGPIRIWDQARPVADGISVTQDDVCWVFEDGSADWEPLTLADFADAVRWSAETKPAGLLAGLSVVQRIASPTGTVSDWTHDTIRLVAAA